MFCNSYDSISIFFLQSGGFDDGDVGRCRYTYILIDYVLSLCSILCSIISPLWLSLFARDAFISPFLTFNSILLFLDINNMKTISVNSSYQLMTLEENNLLLQ